MTRNIIISFLMMAVSFSGLAQEEEQSIDCDVDVPKSVKKDYEKALRLGKVERMRALKRIYSENEEYMAVNFRLAVENIKTAKVDGKSPKAAENYLLNIEGICPDYHSDVYFYLAEIFLGRDDFINAEKYYQKFLKFDSEDMTKYSKKYDEHYLTAEDNYDYVLFFANVFKNPVPYEPHKVNEVSTAKGEYLPLISPDNELLFFTRRYLKDDGTGVPTTFIKSDKMETIERFSMAERVGENKFERGIPLPKPFNMNEKFGYGGACISLDNKHLYLTICRMGRMNYMNCDIFTSDWVYGMNDFTGKEEFHWTPMRSAGDNINGDFTWESQPTLSADGKTLYFATAREGANGIDIFYSEKDSSGEWGPAKNMGNSINSSGNDKTPFMHSDSQTLYFSSDGHVGLGGFDVFYSRQNDDGTWAKPVNIGHPINTADDQHGFVVSTDGSRVYFSTSMYESSNVQQMGLDIASFELYKEARPEKVAFLKGNVKMNNKPVADAKIEVRNTVTNKVMEFDVDTAGEYAAIVPLKMQQAMVVSVKSDSTDLAFNSRVFNYEDFVDPRKEAMIPSIKKEDPPDQLPVMKPKHIDPEIKMEPNKIAMTLDMAVKEVKVGTKMRLRSIYYKTNSADIEEGSVVILEELATWLTQNPDIKIAIYGHTDEIGSEGSNMALSSDRAYTVMAWLQENDIGKDRLSFKGFGETDPVADNTTEEGRIMNRRTEFKIVAK